MLVSSNLKFALRSVLALSTAVRTARSFGGDKLLLAFVTSNGGRNDGTPASVTKLGMASCPFMQQAPPQYPGLPSMEEQQEYYKALQKVNWDEVKSDLKEVMRDSKDWWPADYGHYGGLFIRLAWHATGTYRMR